MIGRAPVQVKGQTVKRFSKKNPKYKVSITNLEKYRNDGGVLYFVVHIDADKNKKYIMLHFNRSLSINI